MTTLSRKLKARRKEKPQQVEVTDQNHQDVINLMRGRTMEMSFTVHGLPKSRRIGGKQADQIAASVKGKKGGIRASWSMFTGKHPAVNALNAAIRDLTILRDSWTIVKSAEVSKGEMDKVSIEGGKRLIWDADIEEFHALFVQAAKKIDKAVETLQNAMDNTTYDADETPIKSVKEMDRDNAGDAWDESVYPKDLSLVVGVAKDRDPQTGEVLKDAHGNPHYVIKFEEYHVSEKLPQLLQERALKRIDDGLSGTIETALQYATNELVEGMMTFLGELTPRIRVFPPTTGPHGYLYEAEVIRVATHADDGKIPQGHVKVYLRYKATDEDGKEQKIMKWFGPMKEADYGAQFRPQEQEERKKIYPTVIEGLITDFQAFKERKARMLGPYGTNVTVALEPLLSTLTKAKEANTLMSNNAAAVKLAAVLKTDSEVRQAVSKTITDTIELLECQAEDVKVKHRRRSIKSSLIGNV